MLDSIRKRKDNLVYTILILAIVAVMALYGVNSLINDQNTSNDGPAAWVNGELISRREFHQELQMKFMQYQAMLGANYDEKFLMSLQVPQRTLQELIQTKLLTQQADKLGILVPDEELADYIRSLPYFQKGGKFDPVLYKKIPNRGIEEKKYRQKLQNTKMQSYLTDRIQLTPSEVQSFFQLYETKIELEVAKLDFAAIALRRKATATEIETFIKNTPEKDLQEYYKQNQIDFTEKAEVRLQKIQINLPYQASQEQRREAVKKVETIVKELKTKDFGEVAKSFSEDESAKKQGDLGWVKRGSLEIPVEKELDKLTKVGQISSPIETSQGYMIFKVNELRPQKMKEFSTVKTTIAEKMMAGKQKKEFAEEKKKELSQLLTQNKSTTEFFKSIGVEVKKTGPFSVGSGYVPQVGQADAILDAVFQLKQINTAVDHLIPVQESHYYVKLVRMLPPNSKGDTKEQESFSRNMRSGLQTELISRWLGNLQKQASIKTELKFQ